MNKLYIKKHLFLSTLLFVLLTSVFFLSCRKNEIQDKILLPNTNYERIRQEFYSQFTYYDLTGENFSIDWHNPEVYSTNKIQYTIFSIIEKGRCRDCENTKEDELPVCKLVTRNNFKTGKLEMFFYKITPSVKFLRSGKKLNQIKWNHDQFRGFKEVFNLKGKLISKEYVNGLNVITDRDSNSGFKIFDISEPCKEVQVYTYTRTCTYSGYNLVGCTAWSLSDISSYYTGDCGTGGGDPPPYTVPIDTMHINMSVLNDTLESCPGDPIKNPKICPTSKGKNGGRNGFTRSNSHGLRYHDGLDIESPDGWPLYSMFSGEVTSTGFSATYGNWIIIKSQDTNGNDLYLKYNHLNTIGVSSGQSILQGNKIGATGITGNASGPGITPHVHIQYRPSNDFFGDKTYLHYNSQNLNPENWLSTKFDDQGHPLPNSNCN
jgi:hypothetical protein